MEDLFAYWKQSREVRRYPQVASDLSNSTVCQENPELRRLAEDYSSAVYQLGHTTDDLAVLSDKTVVEPMKKLVAEFPSIQGAVKKRDLVLQVENHRNFNKRQTKKI